MSALANPLLLLMPTALRHDSDISAFCCTLHTEWRTFVRPASKSFEESLLRLLAVQATLMRRLHFTSMF